MDTDHARTLCRIDDIVDGEAIALEVVLADGAESLIVLRQGESAQVWLNICPHAGSRLDWAPGKFLVSKGLLICAAHGASFRTATGECVGGPCRGQSLRSVPVAVVGGVVYLAESYA